MANHRQKVEMQERVISMRKESELQRSRENHKKSSKGPSRKAGGSRAGRIKFKSVLTQSFPIRHEVEDIVGEFLTHLNGTQKRRLIKDLIRFFELKVVMEEYSANGLLSPTETVAHAWQVLILESQLYIDLVHSIQDFHGRPHQYIHHALYRKENTEEYPEKLERTQRLFKSYYGDEMRTFSEEEMRDKDLPTSVVMEDASSVSQSLDDSNSSSNSSDEEKENSAWYSQLEVPGCYCFGPKNDYDVYIAQQDNASLWNTPIGLPAE